MGTLSSSFILIIVSDKAKNSGHLNIYEGNFWNLSTKAEQLEWRRSKVLELRARGLSYAEIAQQLQVSKSSIGTDVEYLREQAKGTIKEYETEHLPEQYHICLCAFDTILKHVFSILETSLDNREKPQAMELFKDLDNSIPHTLSDCNASALLLILSAEFLYSLELSEAARANLELLVSIGPMRSNYSLFHLYSTMSNGN